MFEEDESDEFLFCKPSLQNLAKLPRKFDWSLSKLILPEVDLFKPGKLNTPVIRAFSFVKQPVDYLLCGKEISFSRAIWLHFPISIRSHSTPCGPQSPILWNLSLLLLWREAGCLKQLDVRPCPEEQQTPPTALIRYAKIIHSKSGNVCFPDSKHLRKKCVSLDDNILRQSCVNHPNSKNVVSKGHFFEDIL